MARLPTKAWARLSAGAGAKGERYYDWAMVDITETEPDTPGCHRLLDRRSIRDGELAFYCCYAPVDMPMRRLIAVAGETFGRSRSLSRR